MAQVWIQLCGRLVADLGGTRIETSLPGRQGRCLFAYLVLHRARATTRDELVGVLWPDGRDGGLSPLLSRLRGALPIERHGDVVQLVLPEDAFVDLEAARAAIHRAESAVYREAWAEAWGPARVALHVSSRGFLVGEEAEWIEGFRRDLSELRLRAHECVAAAGIGLGGVELSSALRSGRALVESAPLRESGYRLLMEALAAEGNVGEALAVHDRLRRRLKEELGIAPGELTRDLHRRLLETG